MGYQKGRPQVSAVDGVKAKIAGLVMQNIAIGVLVLPYFKPPVPHHDFDMVDFNLVMHWMFLIALVIILLAMNDEANIKHLKDIGKWYSWPALHRAPGWFLAYRTASWSRYLVLAASVLLWVHALG